MSNPRRTNGAKRTALRNRVKAMGRPCHICGQPIDYSLTTWVDPKDGRVKRHPLSFELDELLPVSKGGSPFDIENVAPAHRICNQKRGNASMSQPAKPTEDRVPKSRRW